MRQAARLASALLFCLIAAGCGLPRGAAVQSELLRTPVVGEADFAHYVVERSFLPVVDGWPTHVGTQRSWIRGTGGASGQIIAPGDSIDISIWVTADDSLLTPPGVRNAMLPGVLVSPQGTIYLPWVGAINIAGLTPESARARIQNQLGETVPEAQVLLTATPGQRNSVDLISGVNRPGSYPLTDHSLTVLGLISLGGGVSSAIVNPQLRLIRGGTVHRTSMDRIAADPGLDTVLRPGDKLAVEEDTRNFLSLGASGTQRLVPFTKEDLTALEALTLAGGLNPTRANPGGLLILREYSAAAVSPDGTTTAQGPSHRRVIFSIDLTRADGLFSAGRFLIEPGDVLLATESPFAALQTMLSLIRLGAATAGDFTN